MPLPNRVDPFGELLAVAARGTLLGNRGGRFHRDDRTLGSRRYLTRTWICCRLQFKGRRREVWSKGYTELFFLDEKSKRLRIDAAMTTWPAGPAHVPPTWIRCCTVSVSPAV